MTDPSAFAGCRVLVAGASRGIGLAIADAFARHGAALAICARNPAGLAEVAEQLLRHGHRCRG